MKYIRKAGSTSNILQIFIADSSSTTGAGLTGLVFNTASLTAYYHKDNDTTATAITLVTMTGGTFTSSGFKEIDATNMPGWYQFCPPDAAFASGKSVGFHLKGATNMAPLPIEIELVSYDPFDSVRLGLTSLPNAAAEAAGGLYTRGSGAGQINQSANGQVDINLARILNTAVSSPATAGILDVNVKNMNNVAATSITTINANQGTTQPLNFTGTGASATVKSDIVNIGGSALSTSTAQIGVNLVNIAGAAVATGTAQLGVNVVNIRGTVSAGAVGYVGVDWSAINAPTTSVNLSGTTISTSQVVASVTGAVGSVTGAVGSVTGNVGGNVNGNVVGSVGSVTARVTANTDQLAGQTVTAAAGVTFPSSVASPTNITAGTITTVSGNVNGSVGSVTGNVGGNVTGSVGSVVGAVGSVTGNIGGNVTGTIGGLTAGALADFFTVDSGETYASAVAGSVVKETADNAGGLTVQDIVDGVWDEPIASHLSAGSTGLALNSAGSAGDPWNTSLPGAYAAGTAGFILGTNLDATITSRMASYTQPTGFLAATFPTGTIANTTNITAGTVTNATNVTNLTNAPTAGDFTATMKTSLNASTPASITGAVGSVTGNVGGNVVGSVGSVTARVTANTDQLAGQTVTAAAGVTFPSSVASPTNITAGTITTATNVTTVNGLAANVITSASIAAGALNGKGDWNVGKTGYALSAGGVLAIWDQATSGLTAVGSIGKLLVDNIDAAISSRMATYTQPTGFLAATFPGTVASPTNITTVATVTNLTNAPTAGDFTATMKASLNAATPASVGTVTGNVNGSVGSVVGNLGGNVLGTVASVVGAVGSVAGNVVGSVGSVAGNVSGSVLGSVASVVGAVGSVAGNVDGGVLGNLAGSVLGNVVGSVGSVTAPVTVGTVNASASNKKKGVAFNNFAFPMYSAVTGAPLTGLTVVGAAGQDGGAFAALTNSITEIGLGWYNVDLTGGEMNGNVIALKFTATGATERDIQFITQP